MKEPGESDGGVDLEKTVAWYQRFAEHEASGRSALFEGWARGVADDGAVLALLGELPRAKRQPNLLFACSRLVGCPLVPYVEWREWLIANWSAVSAQMAVRGTQTNEPRRCAVLLPVLAQVAGPIALLEVGASAGLCLYPDRYSYSYDGRRIDPVDGPSTVLLECSTTGDPPIPVALPEIVWRAGIDLNPLDVSDEEDTTWLETLIWPEQHERRQRIRAAMDIVRSDPPRIVRGDAIDDLPALVADVPAGIPLVIVSSAAIVYLMPEPRVRFIDYVRALDATWISNEGAGIVPVAAGKLNGRVSPVTGQMLLSVNEEPMAFTGPHGDRLDWL
ncbi:MAG: hypothetical protein QOD50_711 [Actinomycetota bacterium]|nr:hypothetical protein [Actinomycetota bacterium]